MPAPKKNVHCSYCGDPFAADQPWPRVCAACANVTYVNPTPVAIVLIPVDDGLLVIRRAIEPAIGRLALPGGFLELHETWQQGCARELREETGLEADADAIRLFAIHSATAQGLLLVFGIAPTRRAADLPAFVPNGEASEMVVLRGPEALAFPLHTRIVADYFAGR
jgi:ADP-ribose pyrophosphatase YjhB (NUDIX family)